MLNEERFTLKNKNATIKQQFIPQCQLAWYPVLTKMGNQTIKMSPEYVDIVVYVWQVCGSQFSTNV